MEDTPDSGAWISRRWDFSLSIGGKRKKATESKELFMVLMLLLSGLWHAHWNLARLLRVLRWKTWEEEHCIKTASEYGFSSILHSLDPLIPYGSEKFFPKNIELLCGAIWCFNRSFTSIISWHMKINVDQTCGPRCEISLLFIFSQDPDPFISRV